MHAVIKAYNHGHIQPSEIDRKENVLPAEVMAFLPEPQANNFSKRGCHKCVFYIL